jgi:hypothetical protein
MVEHHGYKLLVSEKGGVVGIAVNSTHKDTGVEDEAMKILSSQKGKYKKGMMYYCDMSKDPPEIEEKKIW